ncbi:MAG: hypothetical protein ACREXX_13895 [Gammaproteobacteria bacterium]
MGVRWIETNLIYGEGDWYGQPCRLRRGQKLFLYRWYEYCPACGEWRYDEAIRGAAAGDGKTAFVAEICALELGGPEQRVENGVVRGIVPRSPNIAVAAASYEQADRLFDPLSTALGGRDQLVKDAPLCGHFEVYEREILRTDGRPGKAYRVAAVAGTNEGGLPHLFVCDELHEWGDEGDRKARVFTVIGKSTEKRRTLRGKGRRLYLSTAGFDVDHSLLGRLYKLGKRAQRNPRLAPRLLFDWQEAPDGLNYSDPAQREIAVRAASEAADQLWSTRDRVAAWGKPGMAPHEWIRYFANRWVDVAEESWLKDHPGAWARCRGDWAASNANPWVLVVDMALKQDSVAVARVEKLPDGRIAATSKIWTAAQFPDGRIHHGVVWDYIIEQARGTGFRGVVYDPRFFEVPARMLEDRGIPTIQFDQSPQRMAPACGLTYQLILDQVIVHDGDEDQTAHVTSAVKRPGERGFTLSKGRSKRHIDACVAICMGVWVLHEVPEEQAPPPATANTATTADDRELWRPTSRLDI